MYEHGLCYAGPGRDVRHGPRPRPGSRPAQGGRPASSGRRGRRGGWNYAPTPVDGDLSVSVMQIVAMRAASNAEIPVPEAAIKKAIAYVQAHGQPQRRRLRLRRARAAAPCRPARRACLSLQLLGAYDDPQIPKTLDWIAAGPSRPGRAAGRATSTTSTTTPCRRSTSTAARSGTSGTARSARCSWRNQNKDGSWDVPAGTSEASLHQQGQQDVQHRAGDAGAEHLPALPAGVPAVSRGERLAGMNDGRALACSLRLRCSPCARRASGRRREARRSSRHHHRHGRKPDGRDRRRRRRPPGDDDKSYPGKVDAKTGKFTINGPAAGGRPTTWSSTRARSGWRA